MFKGIKIRYVIERKTLMIKIIIVFGTRPEIIKMCPLIKILENKKNIRSIVCFTGQHIDLVKPILNLFQIEPDYSFNIMKKRQDLFYITNSILENMRNVLEYEKPNIILVHGDTTTAFAASLAAFYLKIPVGHVEAGLRTFEKEPYPEEFNRVSIDAISSFFFAPTSLAKENLLHEGKKEENIIVTGNTIIDTFKMTLKEEYSHPELDWASDSRLIIVTAHRRENITDLDKLFNALLKIVKEYNDVKIIFPVHPNYKVRELAYSILRNEEKIHLIAPLDVIDFHNFLNLCYFIVTDSGGIQEEAPSLKKPVLIVRDKSERPEAIESGVAKIVGTSFESIYFNCKLLLDDPQRYKKMANGKNPFGNGTASVKIVNYIIELMERRLI